MNSSINQLWNKYKNGLQDTSVLAKSANIDESVFPDELTELLNLNNGQNLARGGIFKLIRNGMSNNNWLKYKYIGVEKITEISIKISASKNVKYTNEIPFAISTEFDNGNVCLTINRDSKEISIVTFGFTPDSYDLRDNSSYVQDKNKISEDLNEFLQNQIMFNEME